MIHLRCGTIHQSDKTGDTILADNEQPISANYIRDKLQSITPAGCT